MKTNLVSIFAAAVGLFVAAVQPAFGIVVSETVGYTLTPSGLNAGGCAPTMTDQLGGGSSSTGVITGSLTDVFTVGVADTDALFVAAPPGCSTNYTSENLSIKFNVGLISGTGTGLYQAKYSGMVLLCASSDMASTHGQSDCINWNGQPGPQIQLNLGLYTLDITLNDAVDWNITPTVTFLLVDAPNQHAPEPGTLALLGLGLAGLAASRRRKQ